MTKRKPDFSSNTHINGRNQMTNYFRCGFMAGFLSVLILLSGCSYIYGTETSERTQDLERLQEHTDLLTEHRLPQAADGRADWKQLAESGDETPWKAVTDLNGDGQIDYAYMLTKQGARLGLGVWVLLSDGNTYEPYRLLTLKEPVYCCGIYVKPAGRYGVLTDRDEDGSIDDELSTLELDRPGVEFVYFEASSRIYYWNPETKSFSVAWTSD